jgi:hypothetical protein
MPEMMVCLVSGSKPTRKVGSSFEKRFSAFPNLSWFAWGREIV